MAALKLIRCIIKGILNPENVDVAIKIDIIGRLDANVLANTGFYGGHFENPIWLL